MTGDKGRRNGVGRSCEVGCTGHLLQMGLRNKEDPNMHHLSIWKLVARFHAGGLQGGGVLKEEAGKW